MIRTALKTSVIAAAIAGTASVASPAHADIENGGSAYDSTANVIVIGGYGVTCASVAVAGNSGMNCSHNHITNVDDTNAVGDS